MSTLNCIEKEENKVNRFREWPDFLQQTPKMASLINLVYICEVGLQNVYVHKCFRKEKDYNSTFRQRVAKSTDRCRKANFLQ